MSDHAVSSHSRRSGTARLWRGWTVALLTVLLAAGGHQAAHSLTHGTTETIPWQIMGFALALTAPIAVALAGRGVSTWATAVVTILGQFAFHLLYSLPYTGTSALAHGDHGHDAAVQIVQPPLVHAGQAVHGTSTGDFVMLSAHVLAALLTTWVITHAERSLATIVTLLLLTPIRLILATLPVSATQVKSALPIGCVWVPHPRNITQTRWTRGPPVLA